MRLLDTTLATPALNLALDEALLLDPGRREWLRVWEPPAPLVVLGRSSPLDLEADAEACLSAGAAVRRRASGGATIVTAPGCLMYAVALDLQLRPELADLTAAHRGVLRVVAGAMREIDPHVVVAGTSDLATRRPDGLRKFSGNSVRRVRDRLLYHGTLLYRMDLTLVGRLLRTAPRQPDYRLRRDHGDFVTNLTASREEMVETLAGAWGAASTEPEPDLLADADRLALEKYDTPAWTRLR